MSIVMGNVHLVRKLIDSGTKLDRVRRNDSGAQLYLHRAISVSQINEVASLEMQRLLLQKNPGLLHLTDHHGCDSLHWAIRACSQTSWNFLLDLGASPTTLIRFDDNILHFPLREQRIRIAALFLGDIIRRYDRSLAQSLLRGQSVDGETPIHSWVQRSPHNEATEFRDASDEALLKILLREKLLDDSVVNVADREGQTPLHIIAATDQVFLAEIILTQVGADAAARTKEGDDALTVAEKCGASEEMKTLLRIRGGI